MCSVWSIGCLVSRAGLNSNASSKSLTPSTATYQHGQELILPPAFLVYPQGRVISVCVEKDQENRERYREATSCMRPHFFLYGLLHRHVPSLSSSPAPQVLSFPVRKLRLRLLSNLIIVINDSRGPYDKKPSFIKYWLGCFQRVDRGLQQPRFQVWFIVHA